MTKVLGRFSFVLHSHLPYVINHGMWPHGMDWLNECAAECYIPILNTLYKLKDEGFHPHLTIGITPVLTEQLRDPAFVEAFLNYLQVKRAAAIKDRETFTQWNRPHLVKLTEMWEKYYSEIYTSFVENYKKDIILGFKILQDQDLIEIITCAATHGYLPLLKTDNSVQAQVATGVSVYKKHYNRNPIGIWLPECGYRPGYTWKPPVGENQPSYPRKGVEEIISANGLKYFIIDSHLLLGGEAIGVYAARFQALQMLWDTFKEQYKPEPIQKEKSPYEIYYVTSNPESEPVAIFTRDPRTSIQLWSAEHGYPGDGWYLEFHKKHYPGGLRYWRITSAKSSLGDKWEYEPDKTPSRLDENADHYKSLIKDLLRDHLNKTGTPGIIVAPYDTELFGHWFFEGPQFLYRVLKWIEMDPEIELTTCGNYLQSFPPQTVVKLPEGSWGEGQGHWIWLNEWTLWTWEKIYECEEIMVDLANKYAETSDANLKKIMAQLGRELLLLESSDWQFLISTWSARDYAENRLAEHYNRFKRLAEMANIYGNKKKVDEGDWIFLGQLEREDLLFKDIDTSLWRDSK
ncbi:MAG TPA: 1,4-alpha-glucan branching protein domain-containing protein [Candidatus Deferrimicrobium sp.]|nr:1,4-alpha-glucan branching protein domain-containing protein [Candidatus Deferrimicrobium sp.]